MDPSEEQNGQSPPPKKTSNFLPAVIILLFLVTVGAILFYFNSGPDSSSLFGPQTASETDLDAGQDEGTGQPTPAPFRENAGGSKEKETATTAQVPVEDVVQVELEEMTPGADSSQTVSMEPGQEEGIGQQPGPTTANEDGSDQAALAPSAAAHSSPRICQEYTTKISQFYRHLDQQEYMSAFHLNTSSEKHFNTLIHKLLADPPQVTRETDDLYTILKNTAHFFRVSGKNNILMMKGILDVEKNRLEDILADYYHVITSPDCSDSPYALSTERASLYEYACFFLNTMGGRLYLFRRDARSRMVVTYYAILLVNEADKQHNNRHGIDLKPAVDMLIAEMESGGSSLKYQEKYLDTLYDLKEKYQ